MEDHAGYYEGSGSGLKYPAESVPGPAL
jgi:putative transposase